MNAKNRNTIWFIRKRQANEEDEQKKVEKKME